MGNFTVIVYDWESGGEITRLYSKALISANEARSIIITTDYSTHRSLITDEPTQISADSVQHQGKQE